MVYEKTASLLNEITGVANDNTLSQRVAKRLCSDILWKLEADEYKITGDWISISLSGFSYSPKENLVLNTRVMYLGVEKILKEKLQVEDAKIKFEHRLVHIRKGCSKSPTRIIDTEDLLDRIAETF